MCDRLENDAFKESILQRHLPDYSPIKSTRMGERFARAKDG